MKVKFETVFRGIVGTLVLSLAGAMWAEAQTITNRTTTTGTNGSALVRSVERFEAAPVTFKLDEIPALREHAFLGEPLWKYVASLIYLLLAFYISKLIDLASGVWLKKLTSQRQWKLDFCSSCFTGP